MAHYFSEKQEGPFIPVEIPVRLKDMQLRIFSAGGVFSIKHLDKGTEALLTYCVLPKSGSVLDLGCGYGVVGLVLKLRNRVLDVVQSDVNERALKLTRMNAKKHSVETRVVKSDLFKKFADEQFDAIFVNPPYVAGRELIFRLIDEVKAHLKPGGTLQLVARHQKGGKVLSEKMELVFGNLEILGRMAGYRVYSSQLSSQPPKR